MNNRPRFHEQPGFRFVALFFFGMLLPIVGWGAVCRVTKVSDTNDGACNSDCSLREAVANPSCDTLIFAQTLQFTTLILSQGELRLERPVSIIGLGASRLTISGNNASRIFYINARVLVFGMTLTGGNGVGIGTGSGGAIFSGLAGSLELDGLHLTGNSTNGNVVDGGSVFMSAGTNIIRNSTFSSNSATGRGAAIQSNGGQLNIYNSTFGNNTAGLGSAISLRSTVATFRNITSHGNVGHGSVIVSLSSQLNFGNSIIESILRENPSTSAVSAGHNLIKVPDKGNPIQYQDSDIFDSNVALNPLQLGLGTTPTFGLPAGSPALDAGSDELAASLPLQFDQRGLRRAVDGNNDGIAKTDIGAVEDRQFGVPSGALVLGRVFDKSGRPISGAIVTIVTEELDVNRTSVTNPFGYFRLAGPAGRYCTVAVTSKRGTFLSRIIMTYPNQENIDFYAQP